MYLVTDGSAVLDPDRLPWLPDEPEPRRKRRRSPRLFWAAPVLLVLLAMAGLAYWLGTSSVTDWNGLSDRVRSSLPQPAAPSTNVPEEVAVEPPLLLPPLDAEPSSEAPLSEVLNVLPPSLDAAPSPDILGPATAPATPRPLPQLEAQPGCPAASGCGEDATARLDQRLGSLYSQSWAEADPTKRAQLLRSQDRFVARLEQCGSDACRSGVYVARMREVGSIMAGQWQPPQHRGSGNPQLARLDRHLGLLFTQSWAQADAAKRAQLLRSHNIFLERLETCRSDACANGAYLRRMREVSDIMAPGQTAAE